MKKKSTYFIFTVIFIFLLTGCNGIVQQQEVSNKGSIKYTMYIGLNDKETYTQKIATEDAIDIVTDIALKYVSGFTQYQASGAYTDDEGVVTYENSLVLVFYDVEQEQITNIMDEVLQHLNQNSVLIEKQMVDYDFYGGIQQ